MDRLKKVGLSLTVRPLEHDSFRRCAEFHRGEVSEVGQGEPGQAHRTPRRCTGRYTSKASLRAPLRPPQKAPLLANYPLVLQEVVPTLLGVNKSAQNSRDRGVARMASEA